MKTTDRGRPTDFPYRRVLVTGGVGFIGRHIVRALLDAGCSVSVIDDLSGGSSEALPEGVALIRHDVAEPSVVAAAALEPQLIVHAAAQVSVARIMEDPARDRAVNLDGTRQILEAARTGGCRRFVFLSSGGAIYGETDLGRETGAPRPQTYYGIHKLAAEGYVEISGLPYANLRLANIYGPGQRAGLEGGVVAIFAERLARGEYITIHGDGRQTRDFTFVDDVVGAVMRASATERSGTWNVATGRSTSILDLLRQMEKLTRTAVEVRHVPARAGGVRVSRLSKRRAASELGWRSRYSLAEGLRAMAPPC